jgi:hypothetical protein
MPMRLHAFAALMLGNFCFSSFFERAHSDFQIRKLRLNHLIHRIATQFGCGGADIVLASLGYSLWLLRNHDHALPQQR